MSPHERFRVLNLTLKYRGKRPKMASSFPRPSSQRSQIRCRWGPGFEGNIMAAHAFCNLSLSQSTRVALAMTLCFETPLHRLMSWSGNTREYQTVHSLHQPMFYFLCECVSMFPFFFAVCSTGRIHERRDLPVTVDHWRDLSWAACAPLRLNKLFWLLTTSSLWTYIRICIRANFVVVCCFCCCCCCW